MVGTDVVLVIALAACFLAAVVLAGAETSLVRVRRLRLETRADEGSRRARLALRLLEQLPQVLNAILLTVLLVQIGAATLTGVLTERWFGNIGVTAGSVVLTLVLFVYSEAIPKTFAYHHPVRVALAVAPLVRALEAALRPVVKVLVRFADLHAPGRGIATTPTVTEQELRRLAAAAATEGAITPEDLELIERAFVVGDRTAAEVMVPRVDIVAVDAEAAVGAAQQTALAAGHRRLVVIDGDIDSVRGVVRLRELVAAAAADPTQPVAPLVEAPLFVPEWQRVVDLLRAMQRAATHLAVVVEESGGTAGIVTIEDIVAEMVGRVADEGIAAEEEVRRLEAGRLIVPGDLTVAELEEELGVALPDGQWTTVAGMVMGLAGRIPEAGTEVGTDTHLLRVRQVRRRRIREIEIRPRPPD